MDQHSRSQRDSSWINILVIGFIFTVIVVVFIVCCRYLIIRSKNNKRREDTVPHQNTGDTMIRLSALNGEKEKEIENRRESDTEHLFGPGGGMSTDTPGITARHSSDSESGAGAAPSASHKPMIGMDESREGHQRNQKQDIEKNEVQTWLETVVVMPQYVDLFMAAGYSTLSSIQEIDRYEALEFIGIQRKADCIKMLKAIETLKKTNLGDV